MNGEEEKRRKKAEKRKKWERGDKIRTIYEFFAPMENVSIDSRHHFAGRIVAACPPLRLVSRAIYPERYNSTVLRSESRRSGRNGKGSASR